MGPTDLRISLNKEQLSMEAQWQRDRARLRQLLKEQPNYSVSQLARAVGRSRSWVKKWKKRLRAAQPDDERVLVSRSRKRKQPAKPKSQNPVLVARILDIRQHPPNNLPRVPGPRTIIYYLSRDK